MASSLRSFNVHLDDIAVVKGIAALGTEAGCLGGVGGLPAALVTLVLGNARRLLTAALRAELALVLRTAGAGPAAVIRRLGAAAFRAELTGCGSAACTLPAGGSGLGFGLLAA